MKEETANYMEKVLKYTGMQTVGSLACRIEVDGLLDENSTLFNEAENLAHSLVGAIMKKKIFADQVREQEQRKVYFRQIMLKRKEKWSWEYDYWKEKGWL